VHIYVLGPKLQRWNFLQISQLSIRSGAQNFFPPIFELLAIFDRNLAKIVAPSGNENGNSLVCIKGESLLKKDGENSVKIDL